MKIQQVLLPPEELPKKWYNIIPDLPEPLPPEMDPPEGPSRIELSRKITLKSLMDQSVPENRRIDIPEDIRDLWVKVGRPRPLSRATKLERLLKTPAKIYYKREDLSPTGSFKLNTAVAQVYYAIKEGAERLISATAAGQWGAAIASACGLGGVGCTIYFVRFACETRPYRMIQMLMSGADVRRSPSDKTEVGRRYLKENPNHPGSDPLTNSEALEDAIRSVERGEKAAIARGGATNYVVLHQSVIGLEVKKQLEMVEKVPDIMIGCVGSGTNFLGFISPFVKDRLDGKTNTRFVAVQTEAAPSMPKGEYRYDYGDAGKLTPLVKSYTLGIDYKFGHSYAEGLRQHQVSPILGILRKHGVVEALSYEDEVAFEAAKTFYQAEGVLVCPESAYAVKAAVDLALKAKETGKEHVIVVNISGSGFLDLGNYGTALYKL